MSQPSNRVVSTQQIARTDYRQHFVEASTHPFDYGTADATLILATVPFLPPGYNHNEAECYPVGMTQNFSWNEGINGQFVPEIGSGRKVNTAGTAIGSGTISKMVIHGPCLAASLYRPTFSFLKSFQTTNKLEERSVHDASVSGSESMDWIGGLVSIAGETSNLENIDKVIAMGGMNALLFKIPFGLVEITRDAEQRVLSINYFEQCCLRGSQGGVSAGQFQLIDNMSFEFERVRPLLSIAGFSVSDSSTVGTPDPITK